MKYLPRIALGLCALFAGISLLQLHGQPPTIIPPPPAVAPVAFKDPASFRDVVKKVLPSVVNIDVKLTKKADEDLGFGSGVLIDSTGVVLTNYHVVEGAESVEVQLQDGRKFTSKDIRKDVKSDLAVIRLKADVPLPFLELGNSDSMEVGDRVLAVGAPFGLKGSVTQGIISAKSRNNLKLNQYEDFLQTDAAINPGNSGGPLINLEGQIIGINSAIKTKTGGFQGVGLAISSNMVRDVARQLLKDGIVRRGYLGVGLRELDDELAARSGLKKGAGVVVSKVYDNSPGSKAGLKVGDVITSIDGIAVNDAFSLPKVVSKLPLNLKVEIGFTRDGKHYAQQILIEEQPDDYSATPAKPEAPKGLNFADLGMTATDLTPALATQLGYPKGTTGVLIVSVEAGSPAAGSGLTRSQLIVKVDKSPTPTVKAFADALALASKDKGALMSLMRPTGEVSYAILKLK
jgi:serine protease Do